MDGTFIMNNDGLYVYNEYWMNNGLYVANEYGWNGWNRK